MKPIILALCAMLCYASANVLYEAKLTKVNTFVVLSGWYAIMLPISLFVLGGLRITKQTLGTPSREQMIFIVLTALIWFAADSFFTSAYTAGGTLIAVTSITVMFPAFASVIKYYTSGHTPNGYQIAGYLLAVGAVTLIIRGSQVPQH